MLPGRVMRLPHHTHHTNDLELLKLNALYGANGAGKSNLIKAISLLRDFILTNKIPAEFSTQTFKLDANSNEQEIYLGIEFINQNTPYYYGLTIQQGIVKEEELLESGVGKKQDKLLFRRTENKNGNIELEFYEDVNNDEEAKLLPKFLQNEILDRNTTVLYHMGNRKNIVFEPLKIAFQWFKYNLMPVSPSSKPLGLILQLEKQSNFKNFAVDIFRTFQTGVQNINIITTPIDIFFGEDDKDQVEKIKSDLLNKQNQPIFYRTNHEEIIFVKENENVVAKHLQLIHETKKGLVSFRPEEESDGTKRLIELLPAFFELINEPRVWLIDEIERSIHPLLIKELINKISEDVNTKGQLIFSTHESNLLDQDIFRADEIWFVEKNNEGSTELYPLSDFKTHHTINIQKGYLNGRYGGIPFLGNLKDLNWNKYAKTS